MREAGHDVFLVTPDTIDAGAGIGEPTARGGDPRPASRRGLGAALHGLFWWLAGRFPWLRGAVNLKIISKALVNVGKVDVIHERHTPHSFSGALLSHLLGAPLVLEVNAPKAVENRLSAGSSASGQAFHATLAERWQFARATKILAVSRTLAEMIASTWPALSDRIEVLPNAADPCSSDRTSARRELAAYDIPAGALVIVFVGSLKSWHGVEQLVTAFTRARTTMSDGILLVLGEGELRSRVERQVADLGVGDAVVLAGHLPHSQVLRLLPGCDVAVAPYPALTVPFYFSPLKIFEYMAAGLPIVASRIGQIAEVLTDGENGFLIEPGDVAQLADALARLSRDTDLRLRLGLRSRELVEAKYSWRAYVERLERIYRGDGRGRPGEDR